MSPQMEELERELEQHREHFRRTIDELESRLSPGRLLDEAMHALNAGPREFSERLGRQVRDKPLPAVLTAVGLAWMMSSNRHGAQSGDQERLDDGSDHHPTREELNAAAAWERHQDATWRCVRKLSETEDDFNRRLTNDRADALAISRRDGENESAFSERVRNAGEKVRELSASYRDKIAKGAAATANAARNAQRATSSAIGSGASAVGAGAATARHGLSEKLRQAQVFYKEHAMASGAMGLAIGALIGSALPLSRVEQDRLRGVTDKGLRAGAATVQEAASTAEETARAVREEVSRESAPPRH